MTLGKEKTTSDCVTAGVTSSILTLSSTIFFKSALYEYLSCAESWKQKKRRETKDKVFLIMKRFKGPLDKNKDATANGQLIDRSCRLATGLWNAVKKNF